MYEKRCYALLIAYDGTDFSGFQRHPTLPTIQSSLDAALADLGVPVRVEGGGRTDAGVHACGQVVTFRTRQVLDPASLQQELQARLPPAIRVRRAVEAPFSFHARFTARAKHYRYRVITGPAPTEEEARFGWVLPDLRGFPDVEEVETLDEEAMRAFLARCEGWRDFKLLAHPKTSGKTRRLLMEARLTVQARAPGGATWTFEFRSPGFLRHQVRNLVGAAVTAGLGRLPVEEQERLLAAKGDRWRGVRAPGRGLALLAIEYPPDADPFGDGVG